MRESITIVEKTVWAHCRMTINLIVEATESSMGCTVESAVSAEIHGEIIPENTRRLGGFMQQASLSKLTDRCKVQHLPAFKNDFLGFLYRLMMRL